MGFFFTKSVIWIAKLIDCNCQNHNDIPMTKQKPLTAYGLFGLGPVNILGTLAKCYLLLTVFFFLYNYYCPFFSSSSVLKISSQTDRSKPNTSCRDYASLVIQTLALFNPGSFPLRHSVMKGKCQE